MENRPGKMENLVNKSWLGGRYAGKRVFVTGHTGFKGSWLVTWLTELGATVKGYALAPEYNGGLFDYLGSEGNVDSVISDIRDRDRLAAELLSFSPDYVFHLAAQPLVRRSYQAPSDTFEVNVVGTSNLLEALVRLDKPCTIIVITTDKVYENREADVLYREEDQLGGYDPYSASKACTELVVQSFSRSFFNPAKYQVHRKSICTARAGNVIGGGDYSEDRLVPDIVRSLTAGRKVEIRNPASVRPWQHVLEPLGGYLLLAALIHDEPLKYASAYNFGPMPDDHLTVRQLADLAIAGWGSGQWIDTSDNSQPHEAGLLKLDIDKARRELGWVPRLGAAEAIRWTIDWYRYQGDKLAFSRKQINTYMQP